MKAACAFGLLLPDHIIAGRYLAFRQHQNVLLARPTQYADHKGVADRRQSAPVGRGQDGGDLIALEDLQPAVRIRHLDGGKAIELGQRSRLMA